MKKIFAFTLAAAVGLCGTSALCGRVEITAPGGNDGQGYTLAVYDADRTVWLDEGTASGGEVKFAFDFFERSGKYPYVVTSNSGAVAAEGVLMYSDTQELAAAIAALKAACAAENPGAAVKACVSEYENVFLLEDGFEIRADIEKLDTAAAYGAIAKRLAAGEITADALRTVYREEMLLCAVEHGSAALIARVDAQYGAYLGFAEDEVSTVYAELSDAARLDAAAMEKGAVASAAEYRTRHAGAVAIAAINAAGSYIAIGEIVDKLNTAAGLEFPPLSAEKRAQVLSAVAAKKPFSGTAAFKAAVAAASSSSSGDSSRPSQSTGGSGGGGGSYVTAPGGNNTPAAEEIFSDMDTAVWAKTAVGALAKSGVISGRGDGIFAPGERVTREEFAKILVCAFEIGTGTAEFDDVAPDSWYAPYVGAAVGAGVVYGIGGGKFGVGQAITREDACAMLARAAKIEPGDSAGADNFSDGGEISDYAKPYVAALAAAGAVSGMPDGSFAPKNPLTRAEAAVIIYNYTGGGQK